MNDKPEIPASWLELPLGKVIDYGKTIKADPSEIPAEAWVLELEDIEKDTSQLLQRLTFAERQSKSTKNRFAAGDVIYGKLRPYLDKVLIADQDGYCTTEIVPLKPNLAINERYLFYWLKHPEFLSYVESVSHGIQMPRLGTEAGLKAPLVLAPLNEQRRIVAKLDRLFARSRRAREELERIPKLCDRYKQAILAAAYDELLTEQATLMPLGDLSLEVRNGLPRKPNESPPGVKILRISSLRQGSVNIKDVRFYVSEPEEDITRYYLHSGDLLFTRYNGNASYVAVCGMFRGATETFVYPDKLIRVRIDSSVVLPEFIELISQTPQVRENLRTYIKTAAGQHGISGGDLKRTIFPIPAPSRQRQIVEDITRKINSFKAISNEYEREISLLDRLEQATLAKAFRGELVPQDPNDEPAAALLERLRAGHPTQTNGKGVKSKQRSQ